MCATLGSLRIENDPDVFSFREGVLGCHRRPELSFRDKVRLAPVHGQHVGHHFSGYGKRGPIRISALPFSLIKQGKLLAVARSQSSRLDQHPLDMLLRCLEIGVRSTLSAELFSAPHSPQ
jgi:hypothetical protein